MKFKGEMSMLNVLYLQDTQIESVQAELQKKRDEAPQFFTQSPLVIDCAELGEKAQDIDFDALRHILLELGFIPIGVRNIPAHLTKALQKSAWAVMRPTSQTTHTKPEQNVAEKKEATKTVDEQAENVQASTKSTLSAGKPSLTVERTVRSGQQVYAAESDMTVLAATSAGSELMADGSIHIYGPLRGRVLAGARGDESARIYCQSLQAELIAIAGRYQLLDDTDTDLKGKPVMISLKDEKLIIESLV